MKFLKNFKVSTYLYFSAALFSLLGFIFLLVTNGVQGNGLGSNVGLAITFSVFALLLSFAAPILSIKFGDKPWIVLLFLAVIALQGFLFGYIILNRVELISSLFTWDSNNSLGWNAFYTSIVDIVFYILSSLLISVGMFFPQIKVETKTEEAVA